MLATDGSDSADEALDLAIEIARDAGATLRILSVRPPKRSTHDEGRLRAVEQVGGARRIADASATRARQAGVEATSDVAHGDVVTSIVDAAEALSADLLVVGSRGHSLSEGPAVLGSVSQALVRNSPVPVTVCARPRGIRGRPRPTAQPPRRSRRPLLVDVRVIERPATEMHRRTAGKYAPRSAAPPMALGADAGTAGCFRRGRPRSWPSTPERSSPMATINEQQTYPAPGEPGSPVEVAARYDNFIGGEWRRPSRAHTARTSARHRQAVHERRPFHR